MQRLFLEQKASESVLNNMVWSLQSPDLNPIELLWDSWTDSPRPMSSSKEDMQNILKDGWDNISLETINNSEAQMPRLVQKLLNQREVISMKNV